jgi:hypothetical protein
VTLNSITGTANIMGAQINAVMTLTAGIAIGGQIFNVSDANFYGAAAAGNVIASCRRSGAVNFVTCSRTAAGVYTLAESALNSGDIFALSGTILK